MYQRCRQATGLYDVLFGGMTVVLVGDAGQFPPVASKFCVWDNNISARRQAEQFKGWTTYRLFTESVKLEKSVRIDPDDPDAEFFAAFSMRLRDGACTEDDWKIISKKCTKDQLSIDGE